MGSSQTPLTKSEFDGYYAQLQASALKTTKHAAGLPVDLAFHRSLDSDLAKDLEACSSKVMNITNMLIDLASTLGGSKSAKGKGKARLQDEDDFLDRFGALIVEPMDLLLERADIALDKFSGRMKTPAITINPPEPKKKAVLYGRQEPVIQHAPHLPKPQLKFKRKPDNSNDVMWSATLRHKFNARVPLGYTFEPASAGEDPGRVLPPHPYRFEINNLSYPAHMFQSQTPIPYKPLEETPFTWVSTQAQLSALIDKLRKAREIAIDLEYHSYRTYGGFVCLMQISTREEDWVVDPFELRDELEDLNEIFTNPNIVKVLHGADSDVIWLQQDCNLYLVNMFDTFHASKVLDFPRHGLAHLLEMYCDFSPDKRYQLADWRIRPLPDVMLKYARADTHFLLYVYDNLRNALLDRAVSRAASPTSRADSPTAQDVFVREVLSRSAETALRVYSPEPYDAEGGSGLNGWDTLARRWNKPALGVDGEPSVQREVFRAVHVWRDRVAREEDESTGYVLSNRFVFKLAEQAPADMAALLHAFSSTPPVVRRRAKELLDVIRDAVKKGLSRAIGESRHLPAASSEDTDGSDKMDVDVSSASIVPVPASPSLWSPRKALPTAPTSSLFGTATVMSHPPPLYSTSHSSLFGSVFVSPVQKDSSFTRFQDIVRKIHSALVISPKAPTPVKTTDVPIEVTEASTAAPTTGGATIEIPFVPAPLRQGVKSEVIDDAIIVVGQRQKKRKRAKKAGIVDGGEGEKSPTLAGKAKAEPEVIPFDFASAPNILDDGTGGYSEQEDGRAGKRKRQKKSLSGVSERGNFPAAPKDRREVRSGNVAHTFRP
ncbi:ribonuclease H-like domain-containing protein [Multifurca ochricompacta]|uniref:Ribonuclease H-like domain-containing protein n=1 Tax=Multifurca ochricompacta TaxID=376703 RepID=A0AAD4QMC1_9AGAM|nr:ribonuclease H-like domain-containing protein [Multifurca ochricompacta]